MRLKKPVNLRRALYIPIIVVLLLSITAACKKPLPVPEVTISNSSFNVSEDAGSVSIPLILSGTYDKTITIDYATTDGTAIAGTDYAAVSSGKITILPGKRTADIPVSLIQDTARKENANFTIEFSNPVNCTLKGTEMTVQILNTDYANLVWSDEFSTSPLNISIWNYEQGAGGWGNNELENYTSSTGNVHIDSGYLHITAINPSGYNYTSGRITTKGKKEFTHGRIVIRAKLPEGKGIWPALWMLGSNFPTAGWPSCGEIDMMELLGDNPSKVYGTVHGNNGGHASQGGSYSLPGGKFTDSFHIFTLIWAPNHFQWLVDNNSYLSIDKSQVSYFPFDLPQFFIFNVAVGGNWPGPPDGNTVFPQNMIIDYIRVYQ